MSKFFYLKILKVLSKKGAAKKHDITDLLNAEFSTYDEKKDFLQSMQGNGYIKFFATKGDPPRFIQQEYALMVKAEITKDGIDHLDKIENSNRTKISFIISIASFIFCALTYLKGCSIFQSTDISNQQSKGVLRSDKRKIPTKIIVSKLKVVDTSKP
ncbi:MAG: hypothetical protein JWR67_2382 [Mucilaginibacter sp.]|nr:hypothetical protein [Mucilaginibacter sp.]